MSNASRQQVVVEAVRQWQTRLLQLDRRNALLYFSMGRRGITLRNIEPNVLLERLATSRSGLAFTYAEQTRASGGDHFDIPAASDDAELEPQVRVRPGDLDTDLAPLELQKRLGALNRRSREWQEEQGLNVLFIALGFLRWVDEDQEPACSPILLVSCELKHESPRDPYALVGEDSDDAVVNPTLRHKLTTAANIILPEIGEETVAEYLAAVSRLIAGREGWSVETTIVVATFPFSKLAMWQDLDQMASTGVTHPLVCRLAGDADVPIEESESGAVAIPKDDIRLQGAKLDDLLDVRDQHAVVDADFSQLRAITLARSGKNLVIHGPPGTGKSQTIANIIATLIAEGRRVLFVSEKTAALDVVKRRLADVGLGAFCLDLHSDRGKKASVYAQLREARDQPLAADADVFPYERLLARRHELNTTVRALHEVRQPLGLSVFTVHGRVAAIREVPQVNVLVRDVATLDEDRLRRIQDAARRIARRILEFCDHHTSRWRALGAVAPSPRLADAIRGDLMAISSAIDSIVRVLARASAACGVDAPTTLVEAENLLRLLSHLMNAPGSVPAQWIESEGLGRARDSGDALRQELADRKRYLDTLSSSISGAPPGLRSLDWLDIAHAVAAEATRWARVAGSEWDTVLLANPRICATKWNDISTSLDAHLEASIHLQVMLGVTQPNDSRAAAESAVSVATRLLRIGKVPVTWNSLEATTGICSVVTAAHKLRDELVAMRRTLGSLFGPEIVECVDDKMLVRFRTDHQSFWRWLRPAYRHDYRMIRGCLKQPVKLSLDACVKAIEQSLAVRKLRSRWAETEHQLQVVLGDRFAGLESDWTGIESDLVAVADIYREFPAQTVAIRSILVDAPTLALLNDAIRAVKERATVLDTIWPEGLSHRDAHIPDMSSDARAFANTSGRIGDIVDALGPFVRPLVNLDGLIKLLKVCVQLQKLEEHAAAVFETRSREIGTLFSGWSTDFDIFNRTIAWTQEIVALMRCPLPEGLVDRATRSRPSATYEVEIRAVIEAINLLRSTCSASTSMFPEAQCPWKSWGQAPFAVARAWCDDLCAHADEASDWVEYRSAVEDLNNEIGAEMADALRAATDDGEMVPDIVLRHVYISWLEYIYQEVRELRFSPKDLEGTVKKEFRELDARLPRAARERVRAKCLAAYPSDRSNSNGMGELGVLGHELSKRKRLMPVRKLVARIPNLLQRLKPCFMMSPLAVSQYLPRGVTDSDTLVFDAVIFDEASQIFPEDAIPAIARGRQCIVVGDQQQLPPSSFFRSEDVVDEDGEATTDNRLLDVESILDVLVGMRGAGVDDVHLQVHYRSQHDDLIRYSNHYFYDDRLLTFPSALGTCKGLGIRSVYLPEGRFEAGGSRTNRVEAEQVVRIVFELMETQPPIESIGVVALSRPQADLIQELIDQYRLSDRRFDERFSDEMHERFFVKNLENVQGDERDHVILSIGYGPTTASGAVPNRFGPINVEGGHRRLNVAVSRARRSITVVHSLRPEDIHSEVEGARLLRRYLEFLRSGEASIEGVVNSSPGGEAESPFEDAVGRALERLGYRIARQVGCAKYSIDIAVKSEDGSGFDLAIECDGAAYHRSPSARDRDRLRQEILERMGWQGRIHRVWSTAWIRNPKAELAAIEHAIREARSAPRGGHTSASLRFEVPPKTQTATRQEGHITPNPSSAMPAIERPLLATYVKVDLDCFANVTDLRQVPSSRVADMIDVVVKVEGPVHVDIVVERIRRHYRFGRAGRLVRDAVLAGLKVALRRGTVLWLPLLVSNKQRSDFLVVAADLEIVPRGPLQDGTVRDIDHLCDDEIEVAVVRVVRAMVGATKNEVVTTTARALGYARISDHIEKRICKSVDRLIETRKLVERVGSLVLCD
ncbi:MAG: DUF3320 domain-containing protein [Planctomycetota bacterium]